jgi:hypothetical protein
MHKVINRDGGLHVCMLARFPFKRQLKRDSDGDSDAGLDGSSGSDGTPGTVDPTTGAISAPGPGGRGSDGGNGGDGSNGQDGAPGGAVYICISRSRGPTVHEFRHLVEPQRRRRAGTGAKDYGGTGRCTLVARRDRGRQRLLPPTSSNPHPITIAPTPAHTGTLIVSLSFTAIWNGPIFASCVSLV